MRVGMIGVGKLGQPCAEVMAEYHDVQGYDLSPRTPSNFEMVQTVEEVVQHKDLIFIAVETPHDPMYGGSEPTSHLPNKDFDYSVVKSVLQEVDKYANKNQLVVLISTTLPGTVRREFIPLVNNFRFIYNPYLIAMGTVKEDMVDPEMVIIGTEDGSTTGDAKMLIEFYNTMMLKHPRYEVGTWDEAESIKIFYNCYSEDTEVLTNTGWKLFPEISLIDQVFSLAPDTIIPEWLSPTSIVGRPHQGEMIHFHSSKDDVLVTRDHNMFIGTQISHPEKGYDYNWRIMSANDAIKRNQFSFIRHTEWHNDSPTEIDLGFVKLPTSLYVELMAWFLSEGCVSNGRIIISQDQEKNTSKYNQIRRVMTELKTHFNTTNIVCEGATGVSFLQRELGKYLSMFGKSFDKYVPTHIKNMGKDHIRLFLDIYNLADGSSLPTKRFDGTKEDDRRYKYYATSSDQMAADLGELIVKIGHFPSYRTTRTELSNKDCHLVYELVTNISNFQRSGKAGLKYTELYNYDGYVYCVMLPKNHVFLTRRNGKCTWQGNTFISAKIGIVNMIQDVAEKSGNINVDVVTNALAKSTHRIMGPKYMFAGMGDGGPCHPRDNIALRYMAEELDLGYDLFDAIMSAREVQAENLAKKLASFDRPVVILGKAYKPAVPYTTGSYSMLVHHYLLEYSNGWTIMYVDPNTGDTPDWTPDNAVYLISYYEDWVEDYDIPSGSIVVDPWRKYHSDDESITVVHYGNTRFTK